MVEIAFMKTLKLLFNIVSYSGGTFFLFNDISENALMEGIKMNRPLQDIATSLFIAILLVKLIWLIVDKYLEIKERNIKMDSDREDLDHKKRKNKGG